MKKLYQTLEQYEAEDIYPFHMPGHKRQEHMLPAFLPVRQDITEITGFDDLHHPEELIKEAEERAAALFGAKESWFSVSGSTGAILAAISASVKRGGQILIARNCHKSVYHALYLRDLDPSYIYPQESKELGINGGISPERVERMLEENPDIEAVMITSPTYDGVVSDVRSIAKAAHRFGIPLIVDEAHGAHFCFSDYFPSSAVENGADLVIQSVHKTLPSLTQTALLHRCSDLVDRKRIQRFLGIYQSSSPSYLLMASIDACTDLLEKKGNELFSEYRTLLEHTRKRLEKNRYFRLLTPKKDAESAVFDFDRSKLLISTAGSSLTGPEFHRILHERFHLEMEMDTADYVIALSAVGDTPEGMARLCGAIEVLEREEEQKKPAAADKKTEECSKLCTEKRKMMRIADAMDAESESCLLEESIGRISCEFAYLYPPGIPLIVPGEQITGLFVRNVRRYMNQGLNFVGLDDETNERINVVSE